MGLGVSAYGQHRAQHGVALSESVPGTYSGIWIRDGGLTSGWSGRGYRAAIRARLASERSGMPPLFARRAAQPQSVRRLTQVACQSKGRIIPATVSNGIAHAAIAEIRFE